MHRSDGSGFAAGALVALIVCGFAPASAHSWDPPYADNGAHTYCHYAVTATVASASKDAFANSLAAPTDMTAPFEGQCDAIDDVKTDVWVFSGDYGDDWRGNTSCWTPASDNKCDSFSVKINTNVITSFAQIRKTMCHEIGHTVGLPHYSSQPSSNPGSSCMISGTSTVNNYTVHEKKDHINARY